MNKVVYHGSPIGDLKVIKRHISTHQKNVVYATDNRSVAILFMGRGMGDLDTDLSVNEEGKISLVERRTGVLNHLYNKEGYLYELDGTKFNHYDYLWGPEVVSFEDAPVMSCTKINNILEEIIKLSGEGEINLYTYPNRPSHIPLDNSDLIEKYTRFEEMGIKGALDRLYEIYPDLKKKPKSK